MADEQINVVATFKAKPDQVQAVRAALGKMVDPTRAESGNIGYDLHQGVEDATTFILYEHWRSQADLKNHMQQAYFKQIDEELSDIMQQPYDVVVLRHVAGGHQA